MNTLDAAFAAWIALLSNLSVDTTVVLNPPASDSQITAIEDAIGFELPDDLKALYKITNGQQDPYYVEPAEGKYAVHLLGNDFLSTTQALQSYQEHLERRMEFGDIMDDEITVRDGDFVDAVDWKKGWLPIAGSGANQIAVDLAPPRGGTYGQLIAIGPDEFERLVLATSLTELITAATNNTPDDVCTLEYGVPDNSDAHVPLEHRIHLNPYILYITAKWNHPFYEDNCAETPYVEQPEYLNQANAINARFIDWLSQQNVSEERIHHISNMSGPQLAQIMEFNTMADSGTLLPDWMVPGGSIPQELLDSGDFPEAQFPGGVIPIDFVIPDIRLNVYNESLGFKLACNKATADTSPQVLSIDEYRLFHRYLTLEGVWSEQDYEQAEMAMKNLPEVESSGDAASGSFYCGTPMND